MATTSPEEVATLKSVAEKVTQISQAVKILYVARAGTSEQDPKTRHIEGNKTLSEAFALLQTRNDYPKLSDDFKELELAIKTAEKRSENFVKFWNSRGIEFE